MIYYGHSRRPQYSSLRDTMRTYDLLPRSSSSPSRTRTRTRSPSESSSSSNLMFQEHRRLPNIPGAPLFRTTRRLASRVLRRPLSPLPLILLLLLTLLTLQFLFNASYAPSSAPPFSLAPSANETVFLAANIIDGSLIRGAWGRSILDLVEVLGPERVFVSIYGGPGEALDDLRGKLQGLGVECRVVSESVEKIDLQAIDRTMLPTGETRVKRIAFLAEVRNKVLEPLYNGDPKSKFLKEHTDGNGRGRNLHFDKILFLNDIFFTPSSVLRLLWGTNVDSSGVARYKAVCAADFVRSWKYYDTFATRDAEGFSIGVPIFPWFANVGAARSRRDVLEGRDNVRVRSCWGGMVAFRGGWFMGAEEGGMDNRTTADVHPTAENRSEIAITAAKNGLGVPTLPLRFRSEPEPFWDSSECCLIHADMISLPTSNRRSQEDEAPDDDPWDTGIYMNPYVRTSYSASTHRHLWLAQRFERLLSPVQRVLNYWAGMPRWNYRREDKEGDVVRDRLWISVHSNLTEREAVWRAEHESDHGSEAGEGVGKREVLGSVRGKDYWGNKGYYVDYERVAKRGGYCGVRQLLVMKEGEIEEGGGNWDNLLDRVPPVDV